MKPVPHGEPYAGKLHVRFDEGAGVPDNKGRPALLYSVPGIQLSFRTLLLCVAPQAEWRVRRRSGAIKQFPYASTRSRGFQIGEVGLMFADKSYPG